MRTVLPALVIAVACCQLATGCVTDDGEAEDEVEDLGALDGKADKITTRNLTLRPVLASGSPSRRTFKVTTGASFRVSLAYAEPGATRLIVSDDTGVLAESPITWQPTVVVPAAAAPRAVQIRIESSADVELHARFHVATPDGRALRIATFNIRWYGVGGNIDAPVPEHRNPGLRAFLAEHLADADLLVFEEIVDVEMLRTELVPAGWTCGTYANAQVGHQFVVACHAPGFVLTREADDDDLGYQPLAMTSLRPGVAGVLRDERTGAPLLRLLGVHLKAMTWSTARRLEQTKIIAARLATLAAANEQLPAIVLGDFNAHRAVDTGLASDDWDLMSEVFAAQAGIAVEHVEHPFEHTYRDKDAKALQLDHMWIERARASEVTVAGPCNLSWETDRATIERHFDEISDHCPLIATISTSSTSSVD